LKAKDMERMNEMIHQLMGNLERTAQTELDLNMKIREMDQKNQMVAYYKNKND
jgi:hypothetical protein